MTDDILITLADFRPAQVCTDASWQYFEPHGLDWYDFCRNGIRLSVLRAIGQHSDKIDRLEAAALRRLARG